MKKKTKKDQLKKNMDLLNKKNKVIEDQKKAKMKSLFRLIMDVFKARRVSYEQPKTITIDKGGQYLTNPEPGDPKKIFIIIGWVANNEMKEYILSFDNEEDSDLFAFTFKEEYPNTRILKAIK